MKIICFLICSFPFLLCAQVSKDSITVNYQQTDEGLSFRPKQLILPAALIGMGVFGAFNKSIDKEIQQQTVKWKGDTKMDDWFVFAPGVSSFALDWVGVKSKHAFWDKTVIAATTAVFTLGSSFVLKETIGRERPSKENTLSFPSQHAAVAFAGAELLRQEYGHHSVWYGVAGYGVAACTGFLRIYNNKHWTSDVLVGAGIGILSTKAAYWLYPSIRKLYHTSSEQSLVVLPFGSSTSLGLSLSARF